MSRRVRQMAAVFAGAALLSACHPSNTADLQAFVHNAYRDQKPRIEPIPVMPVPQTFAYAAQTLPDPFSPADLDTGGKGPRPDINRAKGPLEQYPLDALKMVGTLSRHNEVWGVIETPDGGVHKVHSGDHMGQSFGTITRISPGRISLIELVSGPNGGWVSRKAHIAIGK